VLHVTITSKKDYKLDSLVTLISHFINEMKDSESGERGGRLPWGDEMFGVESLQDTNIYSAATHN